MAWLTGSRDFAHAVKGGGQRGQMRITVGANTPPLRDAPSPTLQV